MLTALLDDKADFVELFLRSGLSMSEFLSIENLCQLYAGVSFFVYKFLSGLFVRPFSCIAVCLFAWFSVLFSCLIWSFACVIICLSSVLLLVLFLCLFACLLND